MECLGINPYDGTVYEGRLNCGFRTQPPPVLLPVQFVGHSTECTWGQAVADYAPVLFREDSFDPVTRIRRGRVFTFYGSSQPVEWDIQDPLRNDLPTRRFGGGFSQYLRVVQYGRSSLGFLRSGAARQGRLMAILGSEPFLSVWTVLDVETSAHGTPILTLKARRSFGTLPDLDPNRVPEDIRDALGQALEKVEASEHRLGAEAVIDRCRDALSVVLGHACGDRTLDLGPAIKKLEQVQSRPTVLAIWAGQIVARFHSRAKPNEQEKHASRDVTEDDAQLALSCLGLVLREQGWAKPD